MVIHYSGSSTAWLVSWTMYCVIPWVWKNLSLCW